VPLGCNPDLSADVRFTPHFGSEVSLEEIIFVDNADLESSSVNAAAELGCSGSAHSDQLA